MISVFFLWFGFRGWRRINFSSNFTPIATLYHNIFFLLVGQCSGFIQPFVLAFLSSEGSLQFIYWRTILRTYEKSYVIRWRVHQTQTGDTRITEQVEMSCTPILLFHYQSGPRNKTNKRTSKKQKLTNTYGIYKFWTHMEAKLRCNQWHVTCSWIFII